MSHVTLTELRQNMATYFDRVAEDREPLVVTRSGGKGNVVVMSETEFGGWQETVHLLSSPRNAKRLMESVRQGEGRQGNGESTATAGEGGRLNVLVTDRT